MKKHPAMTHSLHRAVAECKRSKTRTTVPVIVQFTGSHPDSHRKHQSKLMKKLCLHKHHFLDKGGLWLVGGWSAHVSPSCLDVICNHKGVSKVVLDRKNKTKLNIAAPAVGATTLQRKRLTGQGVTIAVLDTGVAPHPDLTKPYNRIKSFKDFIRNKKKPYDDNGHGTHVAGDAAGNGYLSKGKYKGTAPKAKIVAVKVLDNQGGGFDSTIIRGIQWCIANRKKLGIRVLNLSLGKLALEPCKNDPLCQAIEKAVKAGIVVTVAAGNSGPAKGSITSPGTSPLAITVGAVDDRRTVKQSDDRIAGFSGRGPAKGGLIKPDTVAPGVNIVSLRAPGSLLSRLSPQGNLPKGYMRLTGTSFAAPITAGTVAQLLQKNPRLRPSQIKTLIKRNSFSLRLPSNTQGTGELNMRFAAGSRVR
ncbi:S8 family peptidase [Paenibacillus radicis (ex Xue et al. 2023)]|uniref:S8 family peptidase n=1 Tax=Paenibacillus radicis (ex Xue et al. 2023) TaxID=2972489 RepID=A0ABT1YNA4_9BACL|nr:S8 family peptidase [Paenibacillus radicis (ex Xue et al. 2023)]MCR8634653.1 S8 family peptidase [Paenibacillus radicis (ex Xue et al. 2023)]